MAVHISFYIYILIHFFINLIVESIETFVVYAVSRIKLLLLLLRTINQRREVVLSGMPRNSVYKEEYSNYNDKRGLTSSIRKPQTLCWT